MLDTEDYLKHAAGSFQIAGVHLEQAEEQLKECVRMLEDCARMVREIPEDELVLWGQVDDILQDSEAAEKQEMEAADSQYNFR